MSQGEGPLEITVRISDFDLYWHVLITLFGNFRTGPIMLAVLGCGAYFLLQTGTGPYTVVWWPLFMAGLLPWLVIKKSPLRKNQIHYVLSDSGISTVSKPTSQFAEWSWVLRASENRRCLSITFKPNSFILIPKDQVSSEQLVAVRTMLRDHLNNKARLWSDTD